MRTNEVESFTTVDLIDDIIRNIRTTTSAKGSPTVGEFLVQHFGMKHDWGAEYIAFARFLSLFSLAVTEVDSIKIPGRIKERLVSELEAAYDRIRQLGPNIPTSDWHQNVPGHLTATLPHISAALAGRVEYADLQEEAAELGRRLSALQEEILKSGLPDHLKEVLVKRIDELLLSLRNIRIWGSEKVRDSILLLSGELMVLDASEANVSDRATLKKLGNWAGSAADFLNKIGAVSDNITKIGSSGQKLLEYFGDKF